MPTLLLSARQSDDAQLLWRACIALNWKVVRVHDWHVPTMDTNDLAVYGEPLFARHVAQSLGLELQEPPVDWLSKLSPKWRVRDVRLMTLAEARRVTTKAFMKPADEKCLYAKVYSNGTELPGPGPLPEDLPVLVQGVVEWKTEFRCFVLNRKVVALSPYWREGELAKADDGSWPASEKELETTTEFCESVLADKTVLVPEAVVIDVGIIDKQGWAVVETNAAFSSGIYGCSPEKVLSVLQRACRPKSTL